MCMTEGVIPYFVHMEKVDTDVDDTEYEIMSMIQLKMLKLIMCNWSWTTEKDQNELILLNLIQQNLIEPDFD